MRKLKAALFTLFLLIVGCREMAAEDHQDETRVPEFFLTSLSTPHCVLKIAVPGNTLEQREKILLNFMGKGYELTSGWAKNFIPISVDYVEFKYFHIVAVNSCHDNVKSLRTLLTRLLGGQIHVAVRPDNSFLASAQKWQSFPNTISFLRAYSFGRSDIEACTVGVKEDNQALRNSVMIHNAFVRVWAKYRMSIVEVWDVNGYNYIVFSRQCEKKGVLFRRLLELSAREKAPLNNVLGAPDLKPDLRNYFASQL